MLDRDDEARQIAEEANTRLSDQGDAPLGEGYLPEISILAGDHEDASNRLRILCEWLETREQFAYLESYLGMLGRTLCQLGRFDDAEQLVEPRASPRRKARNGVGSRVVAPWRQVLARVHAHRGELAEAERLAREAVAVSERNDGLDVQCLALWDLAEVLVAAQRPAEAAEALGQALDRCRQKKNLALANQVSAPSRRSKPNCPRRPRPTSRDLSLEELGLGPELAAKLRGHPGGPVVKQCALPRKREWVGAIYVE